MSENPTPAVDAILEDDTPSTAVVQVAPSSLDARIRYAREIAAAGTLLPRGVTEGLRPSDAHAIAGRVFLIAETGNMLGVHPVAALQGVHVIEGKPTLSPALMGALVRRAGHKFRIGTTGKVSDGSIVARATVTRSDDPEPFVAEWDLERAERAGLLTIVREPNGRVKVNARGRSGKPGAWETYTEAMLKARATSEVCREAAEDVLMGVHYTPEELGAIVDEEGGVVETLTATPEPEPEKPEPLPEEVAGLAFRAAAACTTLADLERFIREELWSRVSGYSWAGQYGDMAAFAQRVTVETRTGRVPLIEAIGRVEAHLRARGDDGTTGGQDGRQEPPAGPGASDAAPAPQAAAHDPEDPWADGGAMGTPPAGEEDIVDAEVVEDAPADDATAWPEGKVPTEAEAVENVVRAMGAGTAVQDADNARDAATARRTVERVREELAAERDNPGADQGHREEAPAPVEGETDPAHLTGRAAWEAARARLSQLQEEGQADA